MQRKLFAFAVAVLVAGFVLLCSRAGSTADKPEQPTPSRPAQSASPALPIGQVILFSSGVGYFQREGAVEGNARMDLAFPGTDINDLLKSLVLEDRDGGRIRPITYDSPDPVEKTLKSFAIDLTYNPTFGQILNQARGEKAEITIHQTTLYPHTPLTGTIVGMESRSGGVGQPEIESLNLLTGDGMRNINLAHVQRVRFLNPVLESEFQRALSVLAGSHDTQKRVVSLDFDGAGKRRVRVGYVVESPIWKTSYRLVLNEKQKAFLQGWAIVENTTDEDWKNVRMALLTGRPISFQMNLYEPLFVPRSWVEPELFASLRPPIYSGAMVNAGQAPGGAMGGLGLGGGLGALGVGGLGALGGLGTGGSGNAFGGGFNGSFGGGFNRYQAGGGQSGQLGGGAGQFGQPAAPPINPAGGGGQGEEEDTARRSRRLTFEEAQRRREQLQQAKQAGSALAAVDPKQGVASLATSEEIGDRFQYVIDQRVSLPRQRSALIPVVHADLEGSKVSIFSEAVHPKFPVLGLRVKNTSGHPLMQGPVTVYEAGNYAGDARLPDLQPNEQRLLAYAVDLGMEIKAESKPAAQQLVAVKFVKGTLQTTIRTRQFKTYLVRNRAVQDRVLLIEHPVRPGWKLVQPAKPVEQSRDAYRFQLSVAAGKTANETAVEEHDRIEKTEFDSVGESQVRYFLSSTLSSPRLKEALQRAVDLRSAAAASRADVEHRQAELKSITDDQARIRENLKSLPASSAAYKRYLQKFDEQESAIEKLQEQIRQFQISVMQRQKEYEEYLAGLNVE
jgi:hypothetical protein